MFCFFRLWWKRSWCVNKVYRDMIWEERNLLKQCGNGRMSKFFFFLSLLANKSWLWKFVAPDRFFSIKLRKLQTLCFDSDRWIVYYPITMMDKPQNPKFNNCCCLYNFSFIFLHTTGFFCDYHRHSTDISDVLCFPSFTTKYHCTTRNCTNSKYKCRN